MSSFIYTDNIIKELEKILSSDRFETYTLLAAGNKTKALSLYKENIFLSHKFYTILHVLEVCLRNKIDNQLRLKYGLTWYDNPALSITEKQKDILSSLNKEGTHGQRIASLSFGFWTSFFGRFHEELWRHELRFIFDKPTLNRKIIAEHLKAIRNLRNRIAHHECILKMDTTHLKNASLELINWLSGTALEWVQGDLLQNT